MSYRRFEWWSVKSWKDDPARTGYCTYESGLCATIYWGLSRVHWFGFLLLFSAYYVQTQRGLYIYIYIYTHKHRRERPVNHHPHKHRRMHPMCRLPGPLAEWQNHPKAGKWKSGFWVYSMAVAWKRLGRRVVQATNDLVWKAVWSSVLIHAADDAGDRIPPGIIGIVCSYWYQLGRVIWIVKSKHSCCAYKRAPLKLHRFQLGEYGSEEIHPIFTLLAT